MPRKKILRTIKAFIEPYRVTRGKRFRLKDFDPGDTHHLVSEQKPRAKELLAQGVQWLAELQDKLYAQNSWAMLCVFQAMDAAGKDSTIKHVMSGVNPQGCQVFSFKVPSAEDLDHDYMWRYARNLPERGRIGIFNRSYYEEALVVRVHEEILARQRLPPKLVTKRIWEGRLAHMAGFENYLSQNGTRVLKFFLNVSRREQKRRFLERLDEPEKNWKFAASDVTERGYWDAYMNAYEAAIRATATEEAPWYVVPADNKWFTRLVVSFSIVDAMERLELDYPQIDARKRGELARARRLLLEERR